MRLAAFPGRGPLAYQVFWTSLANPLNKHFDLAAACQANFPGLCVRDAEIQHPGFAVLNHIQRFRDDSAFNAAAGHRAQERAV